MTDFDLGKQVGPLPMGAWIAVVGAGLGIGYLINRNMANKSDDDPAVPYRVTESDIGRGGVGFSPVSPPVDEDKGPVIEETNQTWGKKVVRWLVAEGHDPGTSDNAVRKYLYGQNLSIQEQMLLNLAIVKFGPPPEPLPPVVIPVIPPPIVPPPVVKPPVVNPPPVVKPPPPPPPPPAPRTHKVVTNDTLSHIAVRYYGNGSTSSWMRIYNANAGTIEAAARARGRASATGPNGTKGWYIYPGTILVIP